MIYYTSEKVDKLIMVVPIIAQQFQNLFISVSNKQFITIYQYILLTRFILCTD